MDLHHDPHRGGRGDHRATRDRGRLAGAAAGRWAVLHAYFLFPLEEQEETLALVTRALVTAGGLLLVLVAGITWLVTRQVVTPIRMARRVAERLAAGRLQERLRVSGEDDLARLATSFNQMASNLQRQIRQLEELSRLQRRFVSDVSHELRTPLTTVRMAGDVLHDARQDFDPATSRAAELLQTELDRFETLLVDLLEDQPVRRRRRPARRRRRQPRRRRAPGRRRDQAARRPARGAGPRRGSGPRVPRRGGPASGRADRPQPDHQRDRPRRDRGGDPGVVVRLDSDEHAAAVVVRDYGVGLGPGESAMVFNRFWRADPARARTSGGTGLGLSISLEDTHLHGGWLQAWGRPGEGAQFRLTLPRHAGDRAPAQPAAAGAPGRRRTPGTAAAKPERGTPMTRTRRRAALVAVAALTLALLVSGCVGMPDEGPVHESDASADSSERQASSSTPKPPQPQAPPADIVKRVPRRDAGCADPDGVAKQFLSEEAGAAWQPEVRPDHLRRAPCRRRWPATRPRCSCRERSASTPAAPGRARCRGVRAGAPVPMAMEDGEYRIADPRDALVVPADWFEERFRQVSLYFFDPTATDPGARAGVRPAWRPAGLHADQPAPRARPRTCRGSPAPSCRRLDAGLSVPVSDEGVAEIDSAGNAGPQDPDDHRA